ncbi:hypothetical protein SFC55_08920 [Niallia taxi]|uniref:hypothetical protein n=1 Tax=Niallia sp. FSL R7-0271 TaxID=2921678 RepID=UPI00288AC04F|nr:MULTISPECIES: hypothetical protein [Bacillaceae]
MFKKIMKTIKQFSHSSHRSRSYSRSDRKRYKKYSSSDRRGYKKSSSSDRSRRYNPYGGSHRYKSRKHSSS